MGGRKLKPWTVKAKQIRHCEVWKLHISHVPAKSLIMARVRIMEGNHRLCPRLTVPGGRYQNILELLENQNGSEEARHGENIPEPAPLVRLSVKTQRRQAEPN